jgi:LysR family transcriptional regulator, transcriptional activator of nhaA
MSFLNYHHLRYFRAVAKEGNLTRAARTLNLSQSALSIQLRKLEEGIGQNLFDRHHKGLHLTEAGRVALEYADSIFKAGDEMMEILQNRPSTRGQVLRVGAAATLSRNFQHAFLEPVLKRPDVEVILRSAGLRDLLAQLRTHTLDVILSNHPVRRDAETPWHSRLLDEQPVSLVGRKLARRRKFIFPDHLHDTPLLLPSLESNIRASFDLLMEELGIRPKILAEVDDMAMLRLLARDGGAVALVPRVVVQDELRDGYLTEYHQIDQIKECFYAITPSRKFPNPLLKELLKSPK